MKILFKTTQRFGSLNAFLVSFCPFLLRTIFHSRMKTTTTTKSHNIKSFFKDKYFEFLDEWLCRLECVFKF